MALEHLALGQQPTVNVPMVGAPPAPLLCPAAGPTGQTICTQLLNGAVLPGLPVTVAVGGQTVAQGTVVAGGQPPLTGGPLASAPPPLPPGSPLQPGPLPPALLIPGGPLGAPPRPRPACPSSRRPTAASSWARAWARSGVFSSGAATGSGRARRAARKAVASVRPGGG